MSIFPAGEPLPNPLPVDPPVHERLAFLVDELRAAHLDMGPNPGRAIAEERIFDSWNLWCKCIAPLDSIDYPGKLRGETRSRMRPDVDLSNFERGLKTCLRNLGGIIEEIKSSPTPDVMARLGKVTDRLADYLPAPVAKARAVDYRKLAERMRQLKADALDHSIADARMKEYKAQGVSGYRYCVDAGVRAPGIDAQLGVIRAGEGTTRTTEMDLLALAWDMIAIVIGRPGDIDPKDRFTIGGRVVKTNSIPRPGIEVATLGRPDGAWKIGIEDHALVCEQLAANLESWASGQVEPEPVKPTTDEVVKDDESVADWKTVQGRLLAKRENCDPYTSLRKLAEEMGCSEGTIRKAIGRSRSLSGWQTRRGGNSTAPKAGNLGGIEIDSIEQTRETPRLISCPKTR